MNRINDINNINNISNASNARQNLGQPLILNQEQTNNCNSIISKMLNTDNIKNALTSVWFFYFLIILFVWRTLKNNIILVIGILFLWWNFYGGNKYAKMMYQNNKDVLFSESFNNDTTMFVPKNEPRYSLNGQKLRTRPIEWSYYVNRCPRNNGLMGIEIGHGPQYKHKSDKLQVDRNRRPDEPIHQLNYMKVVEGLNDDNVNNNLSLEENVDTPTATATVVTPTTTAETAATATPIMESPNTNTPIPIQSTPAAVTETTTTTAKTGNIDNILENKDIDQKKIIHQTAPMKPIQLHTAQRWVPLPMETNKTVLNTEIMQYPFNYSYRCDANCTADIPYTVKKVYATPIPYKGRYIPNVPYYTRQFKPKYMTQHLHQTMPITQYSVQKVPQVIAMPNINPFNNIIVNDIVDDNIIDTVPYPTYFV